MNGQKRQLNDEESKEGQNKQKTDDMKTNSIANHLLRRAQAVVGAIPALGACFAILAALACPNVCQAAPDGGDEIIVGETTQIAGGTVATWARVNGGGKVIWVGLTIPLSMVENMPPRGSGPAGAVAALNFPPVVQATTYFNHAEIHSQRAGHANSGADPDRYKTPHFDFHFYGIPVANVRTIPGGFFFVNPPADRLPEPLPPGLNLPVVITVQTDGPQNRQQVRRLVGLRGSLGHGEDVGDAAILGVQAQPANQGIECIRQRSSLRVLHARRDRRGENRSCRHQGKGLHLRKKDKVGGDGDEVLGADDPVEGPVTVELGRRLGLQVSTPYTFDTGFAQVLQAPLEIVLQGSEADLRNARRPKSTVQLRQDHLRWQRLGTQEFNDARKPKRT